MASFPTFVNGSYVSQNPIADAEDLTNLIVEVAESQGASAPASFLNIPGVEDYATALSVGGRGSFTHDQTGRCCAVEGASVVEVTGPHAVTVRGTVAVDGNPATISTNGDQLLITSGGNAYSYVLATNTLALRVTGQATQGAVLYGYGLIFDKATGIIRLSDLNDLTTWDPTQTIERSINTDPWQALHVTPYGYIILPGTQTGESWYNAGTSPIPFAPDPSGNFARGIAATFSIKQLGDAVVWLSRGIEGDYTVVRVTGFTPQRISNHGVEVDLSSIAESVGVSDAIGDVYGEGGHLFYLLHLITGRRTWAFDAVTAGKANPWAKRGTWIVAEARYTYWRNLFHTFAFGEHLVLDPETNVISALVNDVYLDVEDRPLRWVRRSPAILDEHNRIILDKFELLMNVGVGTQAGQGADPVVMLRVSRDGGKTWGNTHTCKLGKVGEYWRRVLWRQLGIGRDWVFEVSGSDPVPTRLTAAYFKARRTNEGAAAA